MDNFNDVVESKNSRANILLFLEILKEYSDAEHPLSRQQIVDKFKEKYDVIVSPHTINAIVNFLLSEDGKFTLKEDYIAKAKGGYYYLARKYTKGEIEFLTHAVYSSNALSMASARGLINKIATENSVNYRNKLDNIFSGSQTMDNSDDLFGKLEIINDAINHNKQLSFTYLNYNEEGKLVQRKDDIKPHINPYYMVNNHGLYYLLASDVGGDKLTSYRISYMANIKECDAKIKPIEELNLGNDEKFNLKRYCNEHTYFVDGDVVDAQIVIHHTRIIGHVKDWFGNNAKIYKNDGNIVANIRSNENALLYWCLQYSKELTPIYPETLVNKIKEVAEELLSRYDNQKLDQKNILSLDKLFAKYPIYLDFSSNFFKWDSMYVHDLFHEIKLTKEGENKYIQGITVCKNTFLTKQNKEVKSFYQLIEGRSRIIELVIIANLLAKDLLSVEPDNKEYKDFIKRYGVTKVGNIPGYPNTLNELKMDSIIHNNEDYNLCNAISIVSSEIELLKDHYGEKRYLIEAKKLLDIVTKHITFKVNVIENQ